MISTPVRPRSFLLRSAGIAVALGAAVVGCGSDSSSSSTTIALPPRVVVTSIAGDTESQLLAAMYAQALESVGLRVVRKDPVADQDAYLAQVQADEVQVIPEYAGDLLDYFDRHPELTPATTIASTLAPIGTGDSTGSTVAETTVAETTTTTTLPTGAPRTVEEQTALVMSKLPSTMTVSDVSKAEHKQVIACTAAAVEATTVGTFTDLGTAAKDLDLGGPVGFETSTPLGLATLQETYGAGFASFTALADDKLAEALTNESVDCIVTASTNPIITAQTLTILLDDKALVPPNALLAVISTSAASPDVLTAINTINNNLTTARLNQLMDEVVNKGTAVDLIASLYLQSLSTAS